MIRLPVLLALVASLFAEPILAASDDRRVTAIRAEITSEPQKALSDAQALQRAAESAPPPRAHGIAAAAWLRAEALLSLGRPQDALQAAEAGLAALRDDTADADLRGELVLARGGAHSTLGDVQNALKDYQASYRLFQQSGNRRSQSKSLLMLGSLYSDGGDFDTALKYFRQSSDAYSADKHLLFSAVNNSANVLFQLGRFAESVSEYQRAIPLVADSPAWSFLALRNLAGAQAEAKQFTAANETLRQAFAIASSPAAEGGRSALLEVAARVALREGRLSSAASLINEAFRAADEEKGQGSVPMLDLHRTAYEIFSAQGDARSALLHLEAFRKLDDQQRAVTLSTNAALLNARFNFTNQELRIRDLRVAQERAAARFRNRMQLALLSAAAVVSTLLLIGFLSIRRSRNQVRAANISLQSTNSALEKALAAKTEFLATTSHEIRTPLNGILGMTQVLLAGRQLDPTLRSRIELVHGAGETMKALVDDILDVAKMETGELRIQTGEMDLKRLLEDAVTVWIGQAETKRIGVEFDLADCPGRIIADEVRLRQIIFNLMSNAIKFTDRGQIRLAAFAEAQDDGSERLTVRVADSGIGIPADRIEEIFESFRQVDGGVTRRHGGTGLGLAICRSLARAMGGDVTVASTLGAGSTFTLAVPLDRAEQPATRNDRAAAASLATADVLMIEPNPLGQGIMRALLAGQCANVQFAADLGDGIKLLESGAVDHVVAEGSALGLDDDAVAQLVEACAAAGARLTMLWREPSPERRAGLAAAGVRHIVAKPVSAPDLLSEMNNVYEDDGVGRNIAA